MSDEVRNARWQRLADLSAEARKVAREPLLYPSDAELKLALRTRAETRWDARPRTWRHHVWDMLKDAWAFCFGREP